MKQIFKNIAIIILGIIIGMIIISGIHFLEGLVFVKPENFNHMNAMNWDLKYFIFPFLAHSIGTLSGAFIASKLLRGNNIIIPLTVGVFFLWVGIYMVMIIPAPIWFISLDLILCYITMALLGWKISK